MEIENKHMDVTFENENFDIFEGILKLNTETHKLETYWKNKSENCLNKYKLGQIG